MPKPSIKGLLMTALVTDIERLREAGSVSDDQLGAVLAREDLALLEEKPNPGSWYPIESYTRMSRLLLTTEGKGRPDYLFERGIAAAKRLAATGLYQQLDFLRDRFNSETAAAYRNGLKLVMSMQAALLNFGRWEVIDDPDHVDRLAIRVSEASAFPEELAYATAGFMCGLGEAARGVSVRWKWERSSSDLVLFRMLGSPRG